MKLSGIAGTGSGKLGSTVFATVCGQQVVRQYQPVVANPSTVSQVNNRSKLKLASQLAAALNDVIVIPRQGMKSSRNLFIKKNYGLLAASNGVAQISYENIQLTAGNGGIAAITASRDNENKLTISLQGAAAPAISRVVYTIYKKTDEGELQLVKSAICETPGNNRDFECEIAAASGELVLYAYGMKDANASASAKYANMQCSTGVDIARLVANRTIKSEEFSFTGTRGATMDVSGNIIEPVPAGKARVYVTATNGGTATGGGIYDIGSQVTLTATPAQGYEFRGFYQYWGERANLVSSNPSYTFEVQETTDILAQFAVPENGGFESGS